MSENWKPADVGYVTSYLTVPDCKAAVDFYAKAFSMVQGENMESDGVVMHASMKYRDTHVIMMGSESAPWNSGESPVTSGTKSPIDLYLYHPNVDELVAQAVEAGATLEVEVHEEFWGDKIATVCDPFGYRWTLATKVGELDESKRQDQ